MKKEKILVTAALPYANGKIHLGHIAGAYLPADIFVRYHRLMKNDIIFICGSDEHGVPITISADKEGVPPKVIIDRYHNENQKAFEKLGMSFDIYSRTSIPEHHKTAKEFFTNFYERGLLKEKKSQQFFDQKANMFLPDRYVEGTCPKCASENARSDECENCGSLFDPSELLKPVSKITGETPVLRETSHWYFALGNYQKRLEDYINEHSEKYGWKANVLQYCKGWFKDGLTDRAVTRDLDWGISVPLENAKGKVLYVWFEAVLGYISATKEFFNQKDKPDKWKNYWQDEDTRYVAFIGKDNVVFHCIVFPAMLMAYNDGNKDHYILPENVPANEFLNFEGRKFSKSRNWGIDVIDFVEQFPSDGLRYSLALNLPEDRDSDFKWLEFQARYNNELADILGNFVNRTITFIFKHFDGKVPALYELSESDNQLLSLLEKSPLTVGDLFNRYEFKKAVQEIMNLAREANKYFDRSEPWKTVKSDKEACSTALNICIQTAFTLAELFEPIIPNTSEKLFFILNAHPVKWNDAGKINIQEGSKLNPPEILFRKIEDEVIQKQIAGLGQLDGEVLGADIPLVSFDDFKRLSLQVGEVVSAENVKKSDKLLKLQVSFGGQQQKQIIAGIAKYYKPEELIGKKLLFISNLQPAKIFGLESQGMVLAADTTDGGTKVFFVDDNIPIGARLR